jgi:hypothetical protein
MVMRRNEVIVGVSLLMVGMIVRITELSRSDMNGRDNRS